MSASIAMRWFKIALLLVAVLELAACQPRPKKALEDPPQDVSSGSTLILNRAIVIPAGSAIVHFQDSQVVAPAAIRPNYAYCKFGLDDPTSTARTVEAQSFTVGSVDYDERSAGSVGDTVSATRMNLKTGQQATAYHLTCMLPTAADSARFVTVSQINGAVGGFFTLKRVF